MPEERVPSDRLKSHTRIIVEDDRTSMRPEALQRAVLDHLYYTCSKDEQSATPLDIFRAVAHAARDRLVNRWIQTQRTYYEEDVKRVYYLSAEFLLGRALGQNLLNLGVYEVARRIMAEHELDLGAILEQEQDPGLGNGGLGRLAACFMESMATLGIPGSGYGIRYEFGIFEQEIRDGWQVERPDAWVRYGNVWEIPRHEYMVTVNFYGREQTGIDERGRLRVRWVDTQKVLALPYDMPVAGYGNNTVNNLRLWAAQASNEFNLQVFNDGDYRKAVEEKALSESISKVLYPKDNTLEGQELRLKQQYFFVCASIRDIIRRYKKVHDSFDRFPDKVAIQLNDTHPSIAVAELMRVLLDEEGLTWEQAWEITRNTIAYTNHTLLPEALEKWPVSLLGRLLPRHLTIIYEINHRFLQQVHVFAPYDHEKQKRMSIIEEAKVRKVRMAHLAVVGSHSVNGVAKLHSSLLRSRLFADFNDMWPERFNNKTNGVTPRRWILLANQLLSEAISRRIGEGWVTDLDRLKELLRYEDDEGFHKELMEIKWKNKERLAGIIKNNTWVSVDSSSIFDVQVKRLHEYKRQLLNCLHIISCYWRLKTTNDPDFVPRTFIFGGKAAPGYAAAKLHIKLINDVARIVNNDPACREMLKVVFMANYNVSLAEMIIPAADVSEQISMAGMEASGTGNMKFAMNGALTVGTLDGANIEIREAVGPESFFLFGLDAEQVRDLKRKGYRPAEYIERSPELGQVLDLIEHGFFSPGEPNRFSELLHKLRNEDPYLICADFDDYRVCQENVARIYRTPSAWSKAVIRNLASSGMFSSDRTIREYAKEIWGTHPVSVFIPPYQSPV